MMMMMMMIIMWILKYLTTAYRRHPAPRTRERRTEETHSISGWYAMVGMLQSVEDKLNHGCDES